MTNVTTRELFVTGLLAFVVITVAAVAFLGVAFATGAAIPFAHDVFGSDVWHQNLPFRAFYAENLREGRLPLWCPTLGTGFPLHSEGQVGALYPPNVALHLLLPLAPAFNLSILLSIVLAGTFAAMLARQLGAGRGPSVVAAIVYGLSGFFLVHLKHVNFIAAAAWAPLLLLLLERIATSRSRWPVVLLVLATATTLVAGSPQIAYYNLLLASLYAVLLVLRRGGWRDRLRPAATWGAALGVAALVASPQLMPTDELRRLGVRREGLTLEKATNWKIAPEHFVAFVNPYAYGDPGRLVARPAVDRATGEPLRHPETGEPLEELTGFETKEPMFFWEMVAYVGILPLLLAAAALGLGLRRRGVIFTALILALSLLLALGERGGIYVLCFRLLPAFDLFRVPTRFLVYADLALAVLAALGLSLVLERAKRGPRTAAVASALAAGIVFLDLYVVLGAHNAMIPTRRWLPAPPTARLVKDLEAGRLDPYRIVTIDPERWAHRNAYHRARGWKGDLSPYDPARLTMDPNLSMLWGIPNAEMYSPVPLIWVLDVAMFLQIPPDPETRVLRGLNPKVAALLNIRYVVDPFDVESRRLPVLGEFPGDTLIRQNLVLAVGPPYTIRVLENPAALPRAFLVPRARYVPDAPHPFREPTPAKEILLSREFDPRLEVLITETDPEPDPEPTGPVEPIDRPVRFLEYSPHRVRIETSADRDAWLYLSDTWYPGWSATLDGKDVPVRRANIQGRAVRVPAGTHVVEFSFFPGSFRRGLAAGGFGTLLLLLYAVTGFRPRRRGGEGGGES